MSARSPRFRSVLDQFAPYKPGARVAGPDGRSFKLSSNESPFGPLPSVAEVIARALESGVSHMITVGCDLESSRQSLRIAEEHPTIYADVGIHPHDAPQADAEGLTELRRLVAASSKVVAVGEIGLDYFVAGLDRAAQQALFEAQLRLAAAAGLPVLLHARKAHDQVLATLRRLRFPCGGIAHAFSGSRQQADQYLDLGFRLGFGGSVTYDRALRIRALARELPLTAIVLETDAPDIVTAAHRGERNSPEYLPEVLAVLAELRDEDAATIAARTSANARAVLRMWPVTTV